MKIRLIEHTVREFQSEFALDAFIAVMSVSKNVPQKVLSVLSRDGKASHTIKKESEADPYTTVTWSISK